MTTHPLSTHVTSTQPGSTQPTSAQSPSTAGGSTGGSAGGSAGESRDFLLPDLGEGLADAELLHWNVAVGDTVALNQVIAEVETAKAAVELPSPYAGRVHSLHVSEGETVTVGTPIITFTLPAAAPAAAAVPAAAAAAAAATAAVAAAPPAAAPARVPVLVGYGATSGTTSRRNGRARVATTPASRLPAAQVAHAQPAAPPEPVLPPAAVAPPAAAVIPQPAAVVPSSAAVVQVSGGVRPLAKPLVRKLARDRGIDLNLLTGSGPGGVITRQDVLDHLDRQSSALAGLSAPAGPSALVEPSGLVAPAGLHRPAGSVGQRGQLESDRAGEERIPIRGVRKATAQAMVSSAFSAPTVTEFITVDVTATMSLLRHMRGSTYLDGVRLTVLTFVAKAMLSALKRHPTLNSSWDEQAQEIVLKRYVNLGIATATPRGLMVPSIKYAGDLDLISLARALEQLTATAREGKATLADLTGSTISITNVGVFGVDYGTPILNPGEAAILCLGAVREQPWVHEGEIAIRSVTTLSLSFDHRLVDGEQGSRFLADIAGTLAAG